MTLRKLFMDSRNAKSGSHIDFDYQLPQRVKMPRSRCFVDSAHLPNVFPTIHGQNSHIYISERSTSNVITYRKLALTSNTNYDGANLAAEIAAKMNAEQL